MQEILTFNPRRGRLSASQAEALHRLLPRYAPPAGPFDPATAFSGRPVVVEIGFGVGDVTIEMAQAEPAIGIVAIDVHTPGVARLLSAIEDHGLDNVMVVHDDAVGFLRERVPEAALAGIRIFFPDPWPKSKHHKRRLVRPALAALMASRLKAGASIHCATDWAPYAEAMLEVLDAEPSLRNAFDGYAPRLERPMTKFERMGLEKGHEVADLVFVKREGRS